MPIGTSRLSLLAFPQRWDGNAITFRFLCLPRERPDIPLGAGLPDFVNANLVFSARLIGGLDNLPTAAASSEDGPLTLTSRPPNKQAIFAALEQQFTIVPRVAVARPKPTFSKVAPESYNRVAGTTRRSRHLRAARDYECALHGEGPVDPNEEPPVLDTSLTWGKVIAYALRQPALAEPMGLVGQATITPTAGLFAAGGWLFVDLHGTSDGAGVAGTRRALCRTHPAAHRRSPTSALRRHPVPCRWPDHRRRRLPRGGDLRQRPGQADARRAGVHAYCQRRSAPGHRRDPAGMGRRTDRDLAEPPGGHSAQSRAGARRTLWRRRLSGGRARAGHRRVAFADANEEHRGARARCDRSRIVRRRRARRGHPVAGRESDARRVLAAAVFRFLEGWLAGARRRQHRRAAEARGIAGGDLRPATPADAGESLRRRGRHRRAAPLRPVVRVPGPPRRSHARRPGLELSINRRRLPPA